MDDELLAAAAWTETSSQEPLDGTALLPPATANLSTVCKAKASAPARSAKRWSLLRTKPRRASFRIQQGQVHSQDPSRAERLPAPWRQESSRGDALMFTTIGSGDPPRGLPGPPKEPQKLAQYPKIESIGSIWSIILAIVEVQVGHLLQVLKARFFQCWEPSVGESPSQSLPV